MGHLVVNRPGRASVRAFVLALTLCAFALVALPAAGAAQHAGVSIKHPFTGQRPTELNVHAGVSHRGIGPAAGLRVAIPIVDNGFVSSIDNAVYITVGGDIFFERCVGGCGDNDRDYGVAFAVPVTGRWQFNFTPRWSAYGELGPNVYIHSGWFGEGHFPGFLDAAPHWLSATAGGKWHFAPEVSLTLSLGAPYSHVGLDVLL